MKKILLLISRFIGKGRVFKIVFNLSPMYRRSGGRIVKATDDFKSVRIKLRLNYKTRNYVGTLYGGHMYSCVDGIYMVQIMNILGEDFVVWDKEATIKFKRPGDKTLYANFVLTDEKITQIKKEIDQDKEKDYLFEVDLVDLDGAVYAHIEKKIYIASKAHYKQKRKRKANNE